MCSISSLADSRMSSNPLQKAAKPVCDEQLTQLPSLVEYVKIQKDLTFVLFLLLIFTSKIKAIKYYT